MRSDMEDAYRPGDMSLEGIRTRFGVADSGPITDPEELVAWLTQAVAEAYHGWERCHAFVDCGDPSCADARSNLAVVVGHIIRASS